MSASRPQPRGDAERGERVTPRGAEVRGLLAAGRTNRQIAETLYISERTASVHVSNLLGKLGVYDRSTPRSSSGSATTT